VVLAEEYGKITILNTDLQMQKALKEKVEAFTISTTIKKGIAKQAAAGSLKSAFKS